MSADPTCTQVELHLSAKGLRDADFLSKSDPFVVFYIAIPNDQSGSVQYTMSGTTEVQSNNLNPVWKRHIPLEYLFEVKQLLRFEIYDCDDEKNLHRLEKHDALGFVETDMPFLMGKRGNATFEIKNGRGTLTVKVVELGSGESNESVELRVVGNKLKKMDLFGKSDPYLKISRVLPSGDKNMLHKTEVIKNNLNPEWSKFQLSVGHLCGGNKSQKCICIECWDWDSGSKHDSMGEALVSVEQLVAGDTVELRKPHKPDKLYGVLCFRGTRVFKVPTFFDYIKGGVALSLAVSIDFTASNNDPRRPDSLHYMNPNAPNHYAHAIMSVGDVLKGYVTDERFAVFGFGARLPNENTPNHMFPLTFNPQNPYVTGVQEILNVYGHALTQVRLSGPTNFAPSIRAVTAFSLQQKFTYTIHLIITDGEITDMQDTIDAIVATSTAPLSIIIIGVGTECDFQSMTELDGDKNKLKSRNGTFSQRDIVQFVPMRNFASAPQHVLAREVLREVPKQFLLWAKLANFECPY